MLREFLRNIKNNKSINTHKTYVSMLIPFEKWLKNNGSSMDIFKTDDVYKYLNERKGWSATSGNIFLYSLKSYANYCINNVSIGMSTEAVRESLIEQQRLNKIKATQYPHNLAMNKKPRKRALGMSIEDLEKFFSIAERNDKVISYVLLYFCLRKNELLELGNYKKNFKVDWKNNKATFVISKRKGYLTKTLDFDEQTGKVLKEFIDMEAIKTESVLNGRLEKYDRRMGYRVYPHLFRHASITHFRKTLAGITDSKGKPIYPNWSFLVKIIAGHKTRDIQDDVYTDPSAFANELKSAMTTDHWIRQVNIKWS